MSIEVSEVVGPDATASTEIGVYDDSRHQPADISVVNKEVCLPHAHIVVWIVPDDKPRPDQIDDCVVAELPDPAEDPELHDLAPGGCGKTFLENVLLAKVRSQEEVAVAVATSGIAACLLDGGTTAHYRFKIPLRLHADDNGDFVTVQLKGKKETNRFLAQVIATDPPRVSFLKKQTRFSVVFPMTEDISIIEREQVITKVEKITPDRRGLVWSVDFDIDEEPHPATV
ncbi:hypothetical protein FJT64_017812 [Amphibalanus amphitrite]|uniref:ATP-dependent DNA helicase n=1 Tax=Amphibalanus amphitrite TaxID=1232801 RepID=A0A6A4X8I5_AMPAM|nr:hypothetical protein FJT64_017812 [Amphibalanus amphitrite]